jgi:hypothetical protein
MALVLWCAAEIAVLLLSRGRTTPVTGVRFAVTGLVCFGAWMFLSALSIRDAGLFSRDQVLWAFALLEASTAVAAWGWLCASVRASFRFSFRVKISENKQGA